LTLANEPTVFAAHFSLYVYSRSIQQAVGAGSLDERDWVRHTYPSLRSMV